VRLFETKGFFYLQIFGPTSKGDSFYNCQLLAHNVKKLFRNNSTNGSIWFRNARVQELAPEPSWNKINVVVEYSYQESEG